MLLGKLLDSILTMLVCFENMQNRPERLKAKPKLENNKLSMNVVKQFLFVVLCKDLCISKY